MAIHELSDLELEIVCGGGGGKQNGGGGKPHKEPKGDTYKYKLDIDIKQYNKNGDNNVVFDF